jgi:hypothetical protein
MAGTFLLACGVAAEAGYKAHRELVKQFEGPPHFTLLERVTRYDLTPHNAILFLKNNDLKVNVLVEWTQAGPVMFQVRHARVFMDGRAQQVYDEEHYMRYYQLLVSLNTPRRLLIQTLEEYDTDAVLIRRTSKARNLWQALWQSPQWVPVMMGVRFGLFLREGSEGMQQLADLLRRGEEWRPDSALALAARGYLCSAIEPPDLEQAVASWQAAVRRDIVVAGSVCFPRITRALLQLGRVQEAREYITGYYERFNRPIEGLPKPVREDLLQTLRRCWEEIERAGAAGRRAEERD